jgi:hypothetical protein
MEIGRHVECTECGWDEPSNLWNQRPIEDGLRFALCEFGKNFSLLRDAMSENRSVTGKAKQQMKKTA